MIISPGDAIISAPSDSDVGFALGVLDRETVTSSGSSSLVESGDAVLLRTTEATVRRDGQLVVAPHGAMSTMPVFSSLTPETCSVDPSGMVTALQAGVGLILARSPFTGRRAAVTCAFLGGQTVDVFQSYLPGTIGAHITEELAASGNSMEIFAARNDAAALYVRGTPWTGDLDWTGVSPWNSSGGRQQGGTLVSPCHPVFAAHYTPANGTSLRYVAADGTVVTRTLVNSLPVTTVTGQATDIRVGLLDSDVPGDITHYKVLPADFRDRLVSAGFPFFCTDRTQRVIARKCTGFQGGNGAFGIVHDLAGGALAQFTETLEGGDSGQPAFVKITGESVFLGCHWGHYITSSVSGYFDRVNAAMTTLGGGYQLTAADISAFPSYS